MQTHLTGLTGLTGSRDVGLHSVLAIHLNPSRSVVLACPDLSQPDYIVTPTYLRDSCITTVDQPGPVHLSPFGNHDIKRLDDS